MNTPPFVSPPLDPSLLSGLLSEPEDSAASRASSEASSPRESQSSKRTRLNTLTLKTASQPMDAIRVNQAPSLRPMTDRVVTGIRRDSKTLTTVPSKNSGSRRSSNESQSAGGHGGGAQVNHPKLTESEQQQDRHHTQRLRLPAQFRSDDYSSEDDENKGLPATVSNSLKEATDVGETPQQLARSEKDRPRALGLDESVDEGALEQFGPPKTKRSFLERNRPRALGLDENMDEGPLQQFGPPETKRSLAMQLGSGMNEDTSWGSSDSGFAPESLVDSGLPRRLSDPRLSLESRLDAGEPWDLSRPRLLNFLRYQPPGGYGAMDSKATEPNIPGIGGDEDSQPPKFRLSYPWGGSLIGKPPLFQIPPSTLQSLDPQKAMSDFDDTVRAGRGFQTLGAPIADFGMNEVPNVLEGDTISNRDGSTRIPEQLSHSGGVPGGGSMTQNSLVDTPWVEKETKPMSDPNHLTYTSGLPLSPKPGLPNQVGGLGGGLYARRDSQQADPRLPNQMGGLGGGLYARRDSQQAGLRLPAAPPPHRPPAPERGGRQGEGLPDAFVLNRVGDSDGVNDSHQSRMNLDIANREGKARANDYGGPMRHSSNMPVSDAPIRIHPSTSVLRAIRYLASNPITLTELSRIPSVNISNWVDRMRFDSTELFGSGESPLRMSYRDLFFLTGYLVLGPAHLTAEKIALMITDFAADFNAVAVMVLPQMGRVSINEIERVVDDSQYRRFQPQENVMPDDLNFDYIFVSGVTITVSGVEYRRETICLHRFDFLATLYRFMAPHIRVWWGGLNNFIFLGPLIEKLENQASLSPSDISNARQNMMHREDSMRTVISSPVGVASWHTTIARISRSFDVKILFLELLTLRQAAHVTGLLPTQTMKPLPRDQVAFMSECKGRPLPGLINDMIEMMPNMRSSAQSLPSWILMVCQIQEPEGAASALPPLGGMFKSEVMQPVMHQSSGLGADPSQSIEAPSTDAPETVVTHNPAARLEDGAGHNGGFGVRQAAAGPDARLVVPPLNPHPAGQGRPMLRGAAQPAMMANAQPLPAVLNPVQRVPVPIARLVDPILGKLTSHLALGRDKSWTWAEPAFDADLFLRGLKLAASPAFPTPQASMELYMDEGDILHSLYGIESFLKSTERCQLFTHFSVNIETKKPPFNSVRDVIYRSKIFRCRYLFYDTVTRRMIYQILTMLSDSTLADSAMPIFAQDLENENCLIVNSTDQALIRGGSNPATLVDEILRSQLYAQSASLFKLLFSPYDIQWSMKPRSYVDRVMPKDPFVPIDLTRFRPFENVDLEVDVTPGSFYTFSKTVGPLDGREGPLKQCASGLSAPSVYTANPNYRDLLGVDQPRSLLTRVTVNNAPISMECVLLETVPPTDLLKFPNLNTRLVADEHDSYGRIAPQPRDRSTFMGPVTSFDFTVGDLQGHKATTINTFGRSSSSTLHMRPVRLNQRSFPCQNIFISETKVETKTTIAPVVAEVFSNVDSAVAGELKRAFALGQLPSKISFYRKLVSDGFTNPAITGAITKLLTNRTDKTILGMHSFIVRFQSQRS